MVQNKRVLVIYTGGTFGMLKNEKGVLVPQKNIEHRVIRKLPQLHDNEYWSTHLAGTDLKEYLVLPDGKDTELKVLYKIYEYDELKDSSDFTLDDWIRQARDIKKFYHDYDGFVVLHGTDTTAYGASILSFMLESVGKTVVLTGAQVPIFQPRSDGNNNLLCAVLIAATQHIPEVTVFFGARLFRGTRVKKVSNTKIYAFDSPNFPALLEAKAYLEVDEKMLIHAPGSVPNECRLHDQLCRNVYILKVTPTITPEIIRAVFSGMEGVVLETYGNGNIPIKRKEIYKEIENAVKNKVLVVNVTQCINGTVIAKPLYETGLLLLECGVVPAYDMTAEAAWAKLSYVLTKKDLSYEEKVKKFYHDYDGFVVLHGTDTTAYGASILSFMLESVGKTVVLTGAQVPIFQPRSDGNNNLLCAVLIAATQHIPEVTVFFGARLFRGTRVKKVSNTKIYAFDSPNFPALLEAKAYLEVDEKMLIHAPGSVPNECRLHDQLCRNVYILKVTPTITPEIIRAVFSGMEGVVLETYGNGNIPIKRKEIYKEIENAVKNKVLVVNVTQCINGTVIAKPLYETGLLLLECGVVPAYDMTAEAAWAKLSYVLTKKDLSYEDKVKLMKTNIRGEMNSPY